MTTTRHINTRSGCLTDAALKAIGILLATTVTACTPVTEVTRTPLDDPPPSGDLPGLYDGYVPSATPHWPHLRIQMSDYRVQYLPDPTTRATEYAWNARHFDRIILDGGDARSVPEYRRLLPGVELLRYALSWTVPTSSVGAPADPATTYYSHMQAWYGRHPEYRLEDAFLHDGTKCGGPTRGEACRLSVHIWNWDRWVVNPGDAGLRAYDRERLAGVAADADGLFVDEHSSGDMIDRLKALPIAEYPDWSVYERDVVQLLREIRAAVGSRKRVVINTYNYVTAWDADMTAAAGGAHGEAFNNPIYPAMESRWRYAENILAAGASLNVLPYGGDMPSGYTPGNFATAAARRRIWELASFYLMAPSTPGLLLLNCIGDKWEPSFAASWVRAVEANIGLPTGARRVVAEGRDGTGRAYRVWGRDFERALVLVRPVLEWGAQTYGTETAVEVELPAAETLRPLDADGGVGAAVGGLRLRAGEAAILIKEAGVRSP